MSDGVFLLIVIAPILIWIVVIAATVIAIFIADAATRKRRPPK